MSDAAPAAPNPNEASGAAAAGYPSDQKATGDPKDGGKAPEASAPTAAVAAPATAAAPAAAPAAAAAATAEAPVLLGASTEAAESGAPAADASKVLPPEAPSDSQIKAAAEAAVGTAMSGKRSMSVRFEKSVTEKNYTPSDTSEEWDPNREDEEDSDDPNAPQELNGYLWKKSPSRARLFMNRYQSRYFRVKNAKIHWWASWEEFMKGTKRSKGCLDLKLNLTLIERDGTARFTLLPENGKWTQGNFTGADGDRKFLLDATNTEHPQSEWIARIKEHIDYAANPGPAAPPKPADKPL